LADERVRALVLAAHAPFNPLKVVVYEAFNSAAAGPASGEPAAQVCRHVACSLPSADPAALKGALAMSAGDALDGQ
jgi:hypothetical protein